MPRVGFEPKTPIFERAKTVHALNWAVTVIGRNRLQGLTFLRSIMSLSDLCMYNIFFHTVTQLLPMIQKNLWPRFRALNGRIILNEETESMLMETFLTQHSPVGKWQNPWHNFTRDSWSTEHDSNPRPSRTTQTAALGRTVYRYICVNNFMRSTILTLEMPFSFPAIPILGV
jgi:hypothetical protein